jgi:hypothetical protein
METPKFCKDCLWFLPDQVGVSVFAATCTNLRAEQAPRYNLVSGCPVTQKPYCHAQREPAVINLTGELAERFCGPEGKWWEPRDG